MAFQQTPGGPPSEEPAITSPEGLDIVPDPVAVDPAAPPSAATEPPSESAPETTDASEPPDASEEEEGAEDSVTVTEHQRRRPGRNRDAEARFKRLTAEKYDLARERDAARAERDALFKALQSGPASGAESPSGDAPSPAGRPHPDQFPTQDAYIDALTDWKVQTALAAEQARTAAQRQTELDRTWQRRLSAGRQQYDDFDEAMNDPSAQFRADLTPIIQEVVAEHGQGHALLYALLTDPDMREELDDRTPAAARRYLQQAATRLAATVEEKAPPPRAAPKRATPALAQPVTPVRGTGTQGVVRRDPATIAEQGGSLSDYAKARGPYRP